MEGDGRQTGAKGGGQWGWAGEKRSSERKPEVETKHATMGIVNKFTAASFKT